MTTKRMNAGRHQDWQSPEDFMAFVKSQFGHPTWDVCATTGNSVAPQWFEEYEDGLTVPWPEGQLVYCNPPYKETHKWAAKAVEELKERDVKTILVTKQSCDTKWWHEIADHLDTYLVYPRVQFVPPPGVRSMNRNAYGTMILYVSPTTQGQVFRLNWK